MTEFVDILSFRNTTDTNNCGNCKHSLEQVEGDFDEEHYLMCTKDKNTNYFETDTTKVCNYWEDKSK